LQYWEAFGCRVSDMEAPDEVTCVCVVKRRRKPGVAGCRAINSATLSPALISLNSRTAMKKSK
ncbi:TPA: hypothetical protein HGS83_22415, partial [Escherichia coli]|nr:hypothetical protein [Salmonella enterica subsp. enterica serovar Senftenberg]EEW1798252.1 hypothetical protein [Escherichia coli]HBX2701140.1 hypothetical protein [Klebsiella pneumoniae]EBL5855907.1 hypothetical protein [Salmonella enterica subsp. enterica serovar Senftenberg]EBN0017119.1 hypothetical protein [Salmonella enterica subsp. enterica serovar Senftenberg]